MFDMLADISLTCLIQLAKLLLRQPNRLPSKLHLNASLAVLTLIYDYIIV